MSLLSSSDSNNPFFHYNFDKLCAICHEQLDPSSTRTIYETIPASEPEINVFQVLESISQFSCEDGPQNVCLKCFQNTKSTYEFQQMCNNAHRNIANFIQYRRQEQIKLTEENEAMPVEQNDTNTFMEKEQSRVKQNNKSKQVKCNVCHKMYRSDNINAHMRIHTGEKPYKCTICGSCFGQWASLKYHIDIHENTRRFICNYCGKSFNVMSNLRAHERTHTGEKPYKCDMCEMAFSDSSARKRHYLVHTKEKLFQCEVCSKTFGGLPYLKQHLLTHSAVKKHECHLCRKLFSQPRSLRTHLKFYCHPEKYANASIDDRIATLE